MPRVSFTDYVLAVLWAMQCAQGFAAHLESADMMHVRACFEHAVPVGQCAQEIRHYDFSQSPD